MWHQGQWKKKIQKKAIRQKKKILTLRKKKTYFFCSAGGIGAFGGASSFTMPPVTFSI